jgi:sugar lactone lactonase YvrE
MVELPSRLPAAAPAIAAPGWSIRRLTPPSRLAGANGLATGLDGRLYVAQVVGSQVSAIDVESGTIEVISPMGGAITAPDDLVFDDAGNIYVTEITLGQVAMRTPAGDVRVLRDDIPVANPITWHQGRLIAGECRMGARIQELSLDGGAPRVILDDVPMANAFQVGPDGKLYVPVMGANEIWRVDIDTGAKEIVAGDLGVPDSVKFDSKGRIVTTQVASGQVLRLDPVNGARELLAQLGPGLDNVSFVGERLFVSSIDGSITEIVAPGETRPLIPRGLQWPLGLAVGHDGVLFVSDGVFGYRLDPRSACVVESLELAGMIFWPGCPGYLRGVAHSGIPGEWIIATGLGSLARYRPAAGESDFISHGHDILMGVAVAGDAIFAAEYGAGCVLKAQGGAVEPIATGLDGPMGVAVIGESVFVTEAGGGRISRLKRGEPLTVIASGLGRPEGLCAHDGRLFAVDAGTRSLIELDPDNGNVTVIAHDLPVGAPPGVTLPWLGPIGDMSGPMVNFAGVAAGADGTLYVSGDAEGSVLAVQPR